MVIYVPSLYTLYPVTCVSSVEAFHVSDIDVCESDVAVRLVGVVGGIVSEVEVIGVSTENDIV